MRLKFSVVLVLSLVAMLVCVQVHAYPQNRSFACRPECRLELRTFVFFTDGTSNPLPADQTGNPMVTAILSSGVVRSTNPGQVSVWVEVQHIGINTSFQSLSVNAILPPDWAISPVWPLARGSIHVYFANTTIFDSPNSASFADSVIPLAFEITQPSMITVSFEGVRLLIPNLNATAVGHSLMPYQTILLEVKLGYTLKGTDQTALSYPRKYIASAPTTGWSGFPFYPGSSSAGDPSACYGPDLTGVPHGCFFTAYAKAVK